MVGLGSKLWSFLFFAPVLLTVVSAWEIGNPKDRHGCQAPTRNPLDGCDRKRTLYVDAVSNNSKFKTVQSGMFDHSLHEIGMVD